MKKIISMLLVVGMLCAMMVSVSAFNGDSSLFLYSDVEEVKVGETFQVKVGFKGDTDPAGKIKGGKIQVAWTENASFDAAVAGDAVSAYATQNLSTSTGVLQIVESAAATMVSGDGDYAVLTFTAKEAGTFTLSTAVVNVQFIIPSTTNKTVHKTALAPLSINIVEDAPAFTPETVKGEVVEGDDANIVLPKSEGSANTHTYTNVATFKATLGADVKYDEAGFIWVKDDVESANKFTVDASVITGGGTFEYGVVMAGIPAGVDIDAIPYYVTAE